LKGNGKRISVEGMKDETKAKPRRKRGYDEYRCTCMEDETSERGEDMKEQIRKQEGVFWSAGLYHLLPALDVWIT
jgi:hypothetical protein